LAGGRPARSSSSGEADARPVTAAREANSRVSCILYAVDDRSLSEWAWLNLCLRLRLAMEVLAMLGDPSTFICKMGYTLQPGMDNVDIVIHNRVTCMPLP
jgi:hypothetical protein